MNEETKLEKSNRMSEGVKVALISAVATIVAALLGGVFLLYSVFATSHSQSTSVSITPPPQITSVPPQITSVQSRATFSTAPTPIPTGHITSTPISISPTSGTAVPLIYPSTVTFSSCLSKDNRTFAFSITNRTDSPISWTISPGGSYSYNLLEQNSGQITQGGSTTGDTLPGQQTQAVLVSNILGSGVISVSESGQTLTQGINIICAASAPSSVYPQSVAFDSCSSVNARTFVLNIINNSSSKISWQITNQTPSTSGAFSTLDGKGSFGTINSKQTEVVLVNNITANTIFIVQDQTHNTPFPISITCG